MIKLANIVRGNGSSNVVLDVLPRAISGEAGALTKDELKQISRISEIGNLLQILSDPNSSREEQYYASVELGKEVWTAAAVLAAAAKANSVAEELAAEGAEGDLFSVNAIFNHLLEGFHRLPDRAFRRISLPYFGDVNGILRFRTSGLAVILSEFDVPINRIKFCPECDQIFWAKRITSRTCGSDNCSDNFAQRKRRANPEKRSIINARRRENYRYKKKKNK